MRNDKVEMSSYVSAARVLRIIGHPVRLKILAYLCGQAKCVKEIGDCLVLPQAIVSQHLALLKEKGVVVGKRKCNKVYYEIIDPIADAFVATLE